MNRQDMVVLKEFASSLRKHFSEALVWAFGSRARDTASEDSDMDVCVVVQDMNEKARKLIRRIAWEVGFENDVVITTVKYSQDAFEHGPCSVSPLVRTILREGVPA